MKIKTLILFTAICLSGPNAMGTQLNEDEGDNIRIQIYLSGSDDSGKQINENEVRNTKLAIISKEGFCIASKLVGATWGTIWAVDHTTRFIQTLHSGSTLFDYTFGSYIRAWGIMEAIPLAQK